MALHSSAVCFNGVAVSRPNFVSCRRRTVKVSAFACPPLSSVARLSVKGTLVTVFIVAVFSLRKEFCVYSFYIDELGTRLNRLC